VNSQIAGRSDPTGGDKALLLTVVVPVYNEEEFAALSIERVLRAALPNGLIEIIAVDDGSTDGSGEALEELARRYEEIRVVRRPVNRAQEGDFQPDSFLVFRSFPSLESGKRNSLAPGQAAVA
jgi:cellulose synthase/poly-beta-1,6-N-acetylglucosamine synthase-like glycosyltransferase